MKYTNNSDIRDWNINKGFGDIIVSLIDYTNKAMLNGNYLVAYNGLRELIANTGGHPKINKDKIKKISDTLNECKQNFPTQAGGSEEMKAIQKLDIEKLKETLYNCQVDLYAAMYEAKLMFAIMKQTDSKFSALEH